MGLKRSHMMTNGRTVKMKKTRRFTNSRHQCGLVELTMTDKEHPLINCKGWI